MKATFENIVKQLQEADGILVHMGGDTPRLVMFSAIEDNDDEIKRFELVTSDGFDGYETLHEFDIEDNEDVLLFDNKRLAVMQDTEGFGAQIRIVRAATFDA